MPQVEKVVERVVEVPVERIVEVEKVVGMREEEVEALRSGIRSRAEAEREELLRQGLIEREGVNAKVQLLQEQQERAAAEQAERERLAAELAQIQEKIMHGGEHVKDRVTRQEQESNGVGWRVRRWCAQRWCAQRWCARHCCRTGWCRVAVTSEPRAHSLAIPHLAAGDQSSRGRDRGAAGARDKARAGARAGGGRAAGAGGSLPLARGGPPRAARALSSAHTAIHGHPAPPASPPAVPPRIICAAFHPPTRWHRRRRPRAAS